MVQLRLFLALNLQLFVPQSSSFPRLLLGCRDVGLALKPQSSPQQGQLSSLLAIAPARDFTGYFNSLCIFPPKAGIHPQPISADLTCAAPHQNSASSSAERTNHTPKSSTGVQPCREKCCSARGKGGKLKKLPHQLQAAPLPPGLPPPVALNTTQGSSFTSSPQSCLCLCLCLFGDIPNMNWGHLNPVFVWFLV